jgi:hypothetical protein
MGNDLRSRRGAAGKKPVLNGRKDWGRKRRVKPDQNGGKQNDCDRSRRGIHLPVRKQSDRAMMIRRIGIGMDQPMQRTGAGEKLKGKEEQQRPGNPEAAGIPISQCERCNHRLHRVRSHPASPAPNRQVKSCAIFTRHGWTAFSPRFHCGEGAVPAGKNSSNMRPNPGDHADSN